MPIQLVLVIRLKTHWLPSPTWLLLGHPFGWCLDGDVLDLESEHSGDFSAVHWL